MLRAVHCTTGCLIQTTVAVAAAETEAKGVETVVSAMVRAIAAAAGMQKAAAAVVAAAAAVVAVVVVGLAEVPAAELHRVK